MAYLPPVNQEMFGRTKSELQALASGGGSKQAEAAKAELERRRLNKIERRNGKEK